ncbi:hypothetical protein [Burkholderia cepacia]|uniref:hypothetical protein n=1 Tax=Burkholderia cepacia TaxID=292 RepID=UPI000758E8BA|nr:hypothetical protein [Burkholderia cepacia]
MLSFESPAMYEVVQSMAAGLCTGRGRHDGIYRLAIKAPKEFLLAAKMNGGFKIYVLPLIVDGQNTIGLTSAFFDDEDEPLCIRTPLFDEPLSYDLRAVILSEKAFVHLFDDNDRELLGYEVAIRCSDATKARLLSANFPPFDLDHAREASEQLQSMFGLRTEKEDAEAAEVSFLRPLFPEDRVLIDMRPDLHAFHGSQPFSATQLVREIQPGMYQELDIIRLLHRIFSPEQIYYSPKRPEDKKELVDILVLTSTRALFLQAKDSEHTEAILRNPLGRKRKVALSSLTKAVDQVKGAVRWARMKNPSTVLVGGAEVTVDLTGHDVYGMTVVKELFTDQYKEYSEIVLPAAKAMGVPCVPMDYSEFIDFAHHAGDEDFFFGVLDTLANKATEIGECPRSRFGLVHPEE